MKNTENTTLWEQFQDWRKITEKGNIVTHNTHIHNRSLVWLGTGTSISSGRVKLALVVQTFLLLKWSSHTSVLQVWFSYMIKVASTPFGFIASKTLSYLAIHSFDFEHTWWMLFQKDVTHTKLDTYVFIQILDVGFHTVCFSFKQLSFNIIFIFFNIAFIYTWDH
jgi:hypothetical protein